jgi:cytolysin-activating lysine-acyltransferase
MAALSQEAQNDSSDNERRFVPRNTGWTSGETYWLLDVIAPSQKVATAVLANFKQVVEDKPVRIHPIVSQLVDPALLEKMKVRPVGEAEERDR